MSERSDWFIEKSANDGTAIGVQVTARLHTEQSEFQLIEVFESSNCGRVMVIDNCFMLSDLDHFIYHEVITHSALLAHPEPQQVAIIGGGDCGTLCEVLKHRCVTDAWLVEIDERVTRVAEAQFPALCARNQDPRAHFEFTDGIAWIAAQPENSLDVLIVDSTDPVGPAAGLFHLDFYRACRRALRDDGILIEQSGSPLLHAASMQGPMHRDLEQAGFRNRRTLGFPLSIYPSGWWSVTLASNSPLDLRQARWDNEGLETLYLTPQVATATAQLPPFVQAEIERGKASSATPGH